MQFLSGGEVRNLEIERAVMDRAFDAWGRVVVIQADLPASLFREILHGLLIRKTKPTLASERGTLGERVADSSSRRGGKLLFRFNAAGIDRGDRDLRVRQSAGDCGYFVCVIARAREFGGKRRALVRP